MKVLEVNHAETKMFFKVATTILSVLTVTALGKSLERDDPLDVVCHESQDGLAVFVPHPIDCHLYYECVGLTPVLMSCPDQLYFDSRIDTCDLPENVECQSGYFKQNFQLATLDTWGPLFRISFDLIVYSNIDSTWSSVLAFRGNGAVHDRNDYGDRAPAIFYHNKDGILHIGHAVSGIKNYTFNRGIELGKWHHIELVQQEIGGEVCLIKYSTNPTNHF